MCPLFFSLKISFQFHPQQILPPLVSQHKVFEYPMNIFPYTGIDDLHFDDSVSTVIAKLPSFENVTQGHRVELENSYPSIFIADINMYIVFSEDGSKVRYFEVEHDVIHDGNNLHKEPVDALIRHYQKSDEDLAVEEDGFDSRKFGFTVMKDNDKNIVLVYSREYSEEENISEDDIINFYLSKR